MNTRRIEVQLWEESNWTAGDSSLQVAICLPGIPRNFGYMERPPLKELFQNLPNRARITRFLIAFFGYDFTSLLNSLDLLAKQWEWRLTDFDIEDMRNFVESIKNFLEAAGAKVTITEHEKHVQEWTDRSVPYCEEGHVSTTIDWDIDVTWN